MKVLDETTLNDELEDLMRRKEANIEIKSETVEFQTLTGDLVSPTFSLNTICCQNILVFDFDDTMFSTSALGDNFENLSNNEISLKRLEESLLNIIEAAKSKNFSVYIITNSTKSRVTYLIDKFYSHLAKCLSIIPIISGRDLFSSIFPGNLLRWKIFSFYKLLNIYDKTKPLNLVSVGDSTLEFEAAEALGKLLSTGKVKRVKFVEKPAVELLADEMNLLEVEIEKVLLADTCDFVVNASKF